MARISGIDIPKEKRGAIALTYIYGIGRSRAKTILIEHYRLGSQGVILSRTFKPDFETNNLIDFEKKLKISLDLFRREEFIAEQLSNSEFIQNKLKLDNNIAEVVKLVKNKQ